MALVASLHALHRAAPLACPIVWEEKTLGFEDLERWLTGRVNHSVSLQIVTEQAIVAFLEGPIDSVMRFEDEESTGLLVSGGAGAWTVQLAACAFRSARLFPIPDSFSTEQLMIRMADHRLTIEPRLGEAAESG